MILPRNFQTIIHLYRSLGILTRTKANYHLSLQWFHEVLDLHMQSKSTNYSAIANLHKHIGIVYSNQNNPVKALRYYNHALKFYYQTAIFTRTIIFILHFVDTFFFCCQIDDRRSVSINFSREHSSSASNPS